MFPVTACFLWQHVSCDFSCDIPLAWLYSNRLRPAAALQDKVTKDWRVYDVTEYVDEHPGGMAIMYNAGLDSTSGFYGPQHPDTAFEFLKEYYIGTVADP